MELLEYPIEITAVVNMYNGEIGRGFIALIKEDEGKYSLPTTFLGNEETSTDAVKRIITEQVVTEELAGGTDPIHGIGAIAEAYTSPTRVPDQRVIGIVHVVQLIDNLEEAVDGCTFFRAEVEEKRVLLSTDEETIVLYRDGRVTGDAELVKDHASMVTAIM